MLDASSVPSPERGSGCGVWCLVFRVEGVVGVGVKGVGCDLSGSEEGSFLRLIEFCITQL